MIYDAEKDEYVLASGTRFYANNGVLGLAPHDASTLREGWDGSVEVAAFTVADRQEIAAAMIDGWRRWTAIVTVRGGGMSEERSALQVLYAATLSYLADHDGYEGYPYMLPALRQAEGVLNHPPKPLIEHVWTCQCNYMNQGPVCTHCGLLRRELR